ncbi:hypothetical protein LVJ82_06105 [Vitreoscilla massiliensis]|uniref:Uncharacterized protein n=1 Tax=Vitreoscilla massiliensis TaxID=1689272 RepID=A0ABY4E5G0_9NEIS|nr:hypothetical protein [Vitreoscilla massiliensis]UOO90544.1 hypothetical protein LVJ82_06105 [Vitreoscilla massiliensis]
MWKIGCITVLVALPVWAQASYVESCVIHGKVLQDTSTRTVYINGPEGEYERSDLSVRLRISHVSVSGRADSQCAAFKPRAELDVNISPVPRLALKQGQRIQLQYFKKHNQGSEPRESYQLLAPQ